jgi:hypothetical protein
MQTRTIEVYKPNGDLLLTRAAGTKHCDRCGVDYEGDGLPAVWYEKDNITHVYVGFPVHYEILIAQDK